MNHPPTTGTSSCELGGPQPSAGSSDRGTIGLQIRYWADRTPGAIAIAAPGRRPLTYARLWRQVRGTIRQLNAMGLGPNDRVASVLPDGPEMAVAFLSVSAGCTSAPLNPSLKANEIGHHLTDMNAKAVMVLPGTQSFAVEVADQLGIRVLELVAESDAEAGTFSIAGFPGPDVEAESLAQPDDIALVLSTSGTTSHPKIVPLTHTNLCVSAHNIRRSLGLSQADRSLCVMPLFHVHGLIGSLLSSIAAGAAVFCPPGFLAPRFFEWMEEWSPTWYTAVPTMHQAILSRSGTNAATVARCPLRFARSSSAPLPPKLHEDLESFLNVPVIEAYSMTEASHQATVSPLPPGVRKRGSVGLPAGPQVVVMDEEGSILSPGVVGEIAIRGDSVVRAYENNPAANERAFAGEWFRTGDQGYLDLEGYLFITGRIKEIINRGGEKISPREIDEVLMAHPAVAQAVAFGSPHTSLGEEVAAAVVLRDSAIATEQEIREFAAARLADFKVPHRIVIVSDIPAGPTGKLQRAGLAELLGIREEDADAGTEKADFTAPGTPVEATLADIWREVLRVQRIGVHDNFLALGGDSVLAALILARIRDVLHVEVSFLDFFEASTIAGLAAVVERGTGVE